jgi:hypothetical protein
LNWSSRLGTGFLEEQRAAVVVDAVVEEARERPALDDDLAAEAVAHLDAQLVAVDDDAAGGQAVQSGGAVAAQLVLDEAGFGVGRERGDADAVAAELALEAGHAAAVARQLGDGEAGVEVAEQRVELPPLELQEQLLGRGGLEALLGGVAIERVVAVGLDHAVQALARLVGVARRVVGHGQQELALDAALGEERHAAVVVEALGEPGILGGLDVVLERAVGRRPLGDAYQDPVARLGLEPHADLLLLPLVVAQAQHGRAGLGRGLELEPCHALGVHLERRLAVADRERRVLVQ